MLWSLIYIFKFLAIISSLPGPPSLVWLIIFIISTSLVGSRKKDSCKSLCSKLLWESPSLLILEANVGPMLTKWSLNPFAISLGFVIILLFNINWSDFFLLLFLLITFFYDRPDFLKIVLSVFNLVLAKSFFFYFKKRWQSIRIIIVYCYVVFYGTLNRGTI